MSRHVLVTGGAGFIGTHLVRNLHQQGHRIRVLDVFDSQVHSTAEPRFTSEIAECVTGDVRDPETVRLCLRDVDSVVHLAAVVGVGQSMYEVRYYSDTNCGGTAVLWEGILAARERIEKVVVASSMSIYGEGDPETTAETRPLRPTSVYAVTKRDQEEVSLCLGRAYGIPTVALRFFNVHGPEQSLDNPYTGVCCYFHIQATQRRGAGHLGMACRRGISLTSAISYRPSASPCRRIVPQMPTTWERGCRRRSSNSLTCWPGN